MTPDKVNEVFEPLLGKPAWQVKKGHGSFLTFEFGEPSLEILQPREPSPGGSDAYNRFRARRLVTIRGDWHLWIYCCDWIIQKGEEVLSHNESSDSTIGKAALFLDGQCLEEVTVLPDGSTIFRFDLDGSLKTRPYQEDEVSEQWYLYEPSGYVFDVSSDGTYTHGPGKTPPDEVESFPLFP